MLRFRNQIAVWFSLNEPILIHGSSHGSVFKSPMYRVHNEHESGSNQTSPKYCNTQPNTIIHINTLLHTHMCTCTLQISVHRYTYVYTHIYTYTSIHIYIHIYMHASYNKLTRTIMQTHPITHPLIKTTF